MPLLNSLATPYADALLQITDVRQESEEVATQCKALLSAWESSESLRDAMTSPVLEPDAKKESFNQSSFRANYAFFDEFAQGSG